MATKFIKIKCMKCGNSQVAFSHTNKDIRCQKCDALLLQPKGGKAHLVDAEIEEEYND
ncbi:MAG: 30S ribosomal protein S27e [Candidatus Micrarchaeota archaeon]|nr:30S ribosomal protein S27e [Candidatus Micrarchaeota archaeon]